LAPLRGRRLGSSTFFLMGPTRWCPPSIAKLVYNSNNYGFCWWYIYSFHGIINQLITTHCKTFSVSNWGVGTWNRRCLSKLNRKKSPPTEG
jgi:hypothetical protein